MTHPNPRRWYALKDQVRARCCGMCEYCGLRPGSQQHHRNYARFGKERHSDVMLVCDECHELISGKRESVVVRNGSLADRGDTGRGTPPMWIAYLNGKHHVQHNQR